MPNGERLDLAVLYPNEFFGEMSFLTGKSRTATVETAEEAVILEVTEDQLRDLINRRPRVLQVLQQYSDAREKGTSKKMQSTQKPAEQPAAYPGNSANIQGKHWRRPHRFLQRKRCLRKSPLIPRRRLLLNQRTKARQSVLRTSRNSSMRSRN